MPSRKPNPKTEVDFLPSFRLLHDFIGTGKLDRIVSNANTIQYTALADRILEVFKEKKGFLWKNQKEFVEFSGMSVADVKKLCGPGSPNPFKGTTRGKSRANIKLICDNLNIPLHEFEKPCEEVIQYEILNTMRNARHTIKESNLVETSHEYLTIIQQYVEELPLPDHLSLSERFGFQNWRRFAIEQFHDNCPANTPMEKQDIAVGVSDWFVCLVHRDAFLSSLKKNVVRLSNTPDSGNAYRMKIAIASLSKVVKACSTDPICEVSHRQGKPPSLHDVSKELIAKRSGFKHAAELDLFLNQCGLDFENCLEPNLRVGWLLLRSPDLFTLMNQILNKL